MSEGEGFKIRKRFWLNSSPEPGLGQEWVEYQVVSRSKIVERFGDLASAQADYPKAVLDASVLR